MAVLEMQRISICALKKDRKQILELLQQEGIVEPDTSAEEDDVFHRMDTASQRAVFEKNASAADQALEILQNYVPEKNGMLSSLDGKPPLDYDSYSSTVERQDVIMSQARQLINLSKQLSDNNAAIVKRENQVEALEPWKTLDVPMNYAGTKKVSAFIGTLSSVMTQEEIYSALAESELDAVDVHVVSADRNQTYICVLCGKNDAPALENALHVMGFAKVNQMGNQLPVKQQENLRKEIASLQEKRQELEEKVKAYAGVRKDLKQVSDYYRTRADKYELLGELLQSKKTFLLTGYIPKNAADGLKRELNERFSLAVETEDLAEDEEPPVMLKNNAFSSAYEPILSSYGLPKKGDIDPTTIMSIFYFAFFGLMLSDAGYGLVLFLVCFILLRKYPNMSVNLRKNIRMFMYGGISTMFWGVMFGSYFGDIFNVIAENYFGVTLGDANIIPAVWFEPLKNPSLLLTFSLLFGVIHLFTGLAIKGYMLLRDKKYLDAFCDVVVWYVFLIGLLFMLLPSNIFYGISGIAFPHSLFRPGAYMAIVGAVIILFMDGRSNKNWLLRIGLGAYGLYGTTSWLSDVLSYSRLLALGLATGVIAQVVNQMGSMLGTSIIGTIGFIIIFLFGHTLGMAINLLGAYVHSNRLEYVEFFGKFYEGGGRAFQPFKSNTKYVNFKEEIKL